MLKSRARPASAAPLDERYLQFHANSSAAFTAFPQLEGLRRFLFIHLLVHRRVDGWTEHAKRWLRPLLRRAHTRLTGRPADVLVWLETRREVLREALLPVRQELAAREISTELAWYEGPADLPSPARVFAFPARARAPQWARGAWEVLCDGEVTLRDRALERSFYHAAAMVQGLYDELARLLESVAPKVVLCAATQPIGGAALMVAARQRGIHSLLLQHGMPGPDFIPILADAMLVWGPSSEEIMMSLGLARDEILVVGSPRHDTMRPAGGSRARAALLQAVERPDRPTFVFCSNGHDPTRTGNAAVECAGWLERTAGQYADGLNIVVRLHPNEDGALYRECRNWGLRWRGATGSAHCVPRSCMTHWCMARPYGNSMPTTGRCWSTTGRPASRCGCHPRTTSASWYATRSRVGPRRGPTQPLCHVCS